jgi:hypothetical protein
MEREDRNMSVDINDFHHEKECIYKGERYSVRDNGAVLRYPHEGKCPRPTDNKWTFGKKNARTGYMEIASERVHRIIAIAFHGVPPTQGHVVDHIDTNRCNNRSENLRWVTRLENILLNPITVKRIVFVCGSIEAFLADPAKYRDKFQDPNYSWMCTVSKEEAQASSERLHAWAKSDKGYSGGSLGEWVFTRQEQEVPISDPEQEVLPKPQEVALRGEKPKFTLPPRQNEAIYRTNGEIFGLVQKLLTEIPEIILPEVNLKLPGRGILIEKAKLRHFDEAEFRFEGKARIPQKIFLKSGSDRIAVIIKTKGYKDAGAVEQYKENGIAVLEIDLLWAKEGLTENELKYVLYVDDSKKQWLYNQEVNGIINETTQKLLKVCEPIHSYRAVFHSYIDNCPLMTEPYNGRNGVDSMDCGYCEYHLSIDNAAEIDGCFGKSRIETYEDILSIVDVEKRDGQIVGITFCRGDNTVTEKFRFAEALGKTLLKLWEERKGDKIIAYNVASGWYVLMDEDPNESLRKNGEVYARLSRSIDGLQANSPHSIFGYDNMVWEAIQE